VTLGAGGTPGDPRPIGVFDSGVGGLTVVRALRRALPEEQIVYLGDTARLPYGTKTAATVARYALQAAGALVAQDVKLLVIACNTATALALEPLRAALAPLPVVGVIEPGAAAAVAASRGRRIAVLATESTIAHGAYDAAIRRLAPDAVVLGRACPLFVSLAEEGWVDGEVPAAVASHYVSDLPAAGFDTVVLGCTHFPVLEPVLGRVLGPRIALVDSAQTTAAVVAAVLAQGALAAPGGGAGSGAACRFLATDGPDRFARVGARFLGEPVEPASVRLVDL
jgi:glutamate racemase